VLQGGLLEEVSRDVAAVEVDASNNGDPTVVEGLGALQSARRRFDAAVRALPHSHRPCTAAYGGEGGEGEREGRGGRVGMKSQTLTLAYTGVLATEQNIRSP